MAHSNEPKGENPSSIAANDIANPTMGKLDHAHLEMSGNETGVVDNGGDTAMALFANDEQIHDTIDAEVERKLVRKIDLLILPYLIVCYMFFYIDKTTLSYAAIFGIKTDLNLVGTQYSWLSSVFYFGFLVWSVPTNFLLQRFPIARYLGINIFGWGAFLILQAAAPNFRALAALRAISGAAEACADPCFMLITSMWYTRRQQPIRIGIWYCANGLGIAFGGLLGYAIGQIKGALPSWKYEFIIVGTLCCTWGIILILLLPDSPVTTKRLTLEERRIAVSRLLDNQTGVENKHLKRYQVIEALKDYKSYFFFLIALSANIPNGGVSNFGTLIIKGFGYSTLGTSLLQIPYGIIITLSVLTCVFINDRLPPNSRCVVIALFLLPNIAGTFGLRFAPASSHVGRLMCYYLTGPYNAAMVLFLSIQVANTAGHTKKVITSAMLFLGYCVGNIVGPFFYLTSQAPTYSLGIWSMIVSHFSEMVLILALRFLLKWENDKRDKLQGINKYATEADAAAIEEKRIKDLKLTAFSDLTDRENLNFRYIY